MNAFRDLPTTDHNAEKLAAEVNRIYERAKAASGVLEESEIMELV